MNKSFLNDDDNLFVSYETRLQRQQKLKKQLTEKDEHIRRIQNEQINFAKIKNQTERQLRGVIDDQQKVIDDHKQVIDEQQRLIRQLCASERTKVTCKVCNKIFVEPVDLPCSNSICKSHLNQFKKEYCIFCSTRHFNDEDNHDAKPNEDLSQTLAKNFHLTEQEKKIKEEIERIFLDTKFLTEILNFKETESEKYCFDHFAKLTNSIDLQREELKLKIDDIAERLINQVKERKSLFETEMNASLDHLSLLKIEQLENKFADEMRELHIAEDNLDSIKSELIANSLVLNTKTNDIDQLRKRIATCTICIEKINLDSRVFGKLNLDKFT